MTKTWARVTGRVYTFLIVPIASAFVAGVLFVLSLSPTARAYAAGAVSSFVPLFTILAAAIGWFVAAALNGEEARRAERDRRKHARQGTLRQVRTLLRDAVRTIGPFFYFFKPLALGDIEHTYDRFVDRLNERETAIDLSDAEYDTLDAFVAKLGQAIGRAQEYAAQYPATGPSSFGLTSSAHDPIVADPTPDSVDDDSTKKEQERERTRAATKVRVFFMDRFHTTLPALDSALDLFGNEDEEMRAEFKKMTVRADGAIRTLAVSSSAQPNF
jgi:hypothetical protein